MKTKLSKKMLLREAAQQKGALNRLQDWLWNAMCLSSYATVRAWWRLEGVGLRLVCGVAGIVLATVSAVCTAMVGFGICNGRRNVTYILKVVEQA